LSKLAADFPKCEIDQSAESVAELSKSWPKGYAMLTAFIRQQVAGGHWEKVSKRENGRFVAAYRRTKARR
jgi:hypothetical protein